jgi:polysaccharide export outer membrane protein
MSLLNSSSLLVALAILAAAPAVSAQSPPAAARPPTGRAPGVPTLPDYLIGVEDVLGVVFWREPDMTGDVTVRPDGLITLPLVGDIQAAGLRPDALREEIRKAAARFVEDPNVTVVVRQINSRKVFITGQVAQPGSHPALAPMTVMQLIALAGGLTEFADKENISVLRVEQGQTRSFKFNYKDVSKGKNLAQNIVLKPGDTVVVP